MLQFVLKLYTTQNVKGINHLRSIMAASKTINQLPPTEDSLRQHLLRVNYQSNVWLNSLNPNPSLLEVSENGWKIEDNKLMPILTTKPVMPAEKPFLTTCNCKKGCAGLQCSCKKRNYVCIGSCKCLGQAPNCNNTKKQILEEENSSSDTDSN